MALSRAHTSSKAANPAKSSLLKQTPGITHSVVWYHSADTYKPSVVQYDSVYTYKHSVAWYHTAYTYKPSVMEYDSADTYKPSVVWYHSVYTYKPSVVEYDSADTYKPNVVKYRASCGHLPNRNHNPTLTLTLR